MAWGVRNLISTQVYAPAPAGPTSSLELRAARGRLAEDSAFILTNRSHPTALMRASVMERALHFTAAVQAVGASERDGAGAAGVAGRVHCFGATGGDTDLYGRLRSTSPNAVAYSWSTRQLLGHPRGLVGVSEVES